MLKNLSVPGRSVEENLPRIKVIGVGGAGGNAIANMLTEGMSGVDFLICNTDAQDLLKSYCENRLQLGVESTRGMGAGCSPALGREAAEESADEIRAQLQDAQMVFLAAGMGGGTGTGAAPVIAKLAKDMGILTVAIITTPFAFEGKQRRQVAEQGVADMESIVDTLSVINNQNLFCISTETTSMQEAFETADRVLASSVRSITDLVTRPGVINRDFADVRSVMENGGRALISTVEAEGDDRAERAAEAVVLNPLLEKVDIATAQKLLIHVVGAKDLKLFEVQEIVDRIGESVDGEPSVAFGYSLDEAISGRLRVSVVATGIDNPEEARQPSTNNLADDETRNDKAAMWYDTHQRSIRREAEEQSPSAQGALSETLNGTANGAAISEATNGVANGVANGDLNRFGLAKDVDEKPAQNISEDVSQAAGGFRAALKQNLTTPKAAPAGNAVGYSSALTARNLLKARPPTRDGARASHASTNPSSAGKPVTKLASKHASAAEGKVVKNVGVAQSVLEAVRGFMGLKGPEISSTHPLYLTHESGATGSLPLQSLAETTGNGIEKPASFHATGSPHAESQPVGLPAFLQRQRD